MLLLEDDRELCRTLRDALTMEGYAVLTAASLASQGGPDDLASGSLFPPVDSLRRVTAQIAAAVGPMPSTQGQAQCEAAVADRTRD